MRETGVAPGLSRRCRLATGLCVLMAISITSRASELDYNLGHGSIITRLDFSPDGKLLVAGDQGGEVKIWDAGSLQLLRTLGPPRGHITSLQFSPDGEQVAAATRNSSLTVWKVETGRELSTIRVGDLGAVTLAFDPRARGLATADNAGTITLRDFRSGKAVALRGHEAFVNELRYSPDGTMLASASWDNVAILWDSDLKGELYRLTAHDSFVNSVAFDPTGERIATGDGAGRVMEWDTSNGARIRDFQAHQNEIWQLRFAPDGVLISTSMDGTVALWRDGELVDRRKVPGKEAREAQAYSVAVAPDGGSFATAHADRRIRLWSMESTTPVAETESGELPLRPEAAASSADGRLAVEGPTGEVRVWNVSSAQLDYTLPRSVFGSLKKNLADIAFSPNGSLIATSGQQDDIRVWDASSGRLLKLIRSEPVEERTYRPVTLHGFSRDGETLVAAHGTKRVTLWNWRSANRIHGPFELRTNTLDSCVVRGMKADVSALFYSCGRSLGLISPAVQEMVSTAERAAEIKSPILADTGTWVFAETPNAETTRILVSKEWGANPIELALVEGRPSMALDISGRWLATYFTGGRLTLWDVDEGQEVWTSETGVPVVEKVLMNADVIALVAPRGRLRFVNRSDGAGAGALQLLPAGDWVLESEMGDVLSASEHGREYVRIRTGE